MYKWNAFYDANYDYEINGLPNCIPNDSTPFVLYSGVMATLIPPLVYIAIIAAVLIITFIIDKKSKKAAIADNN